MAPRSRLPKPKFSLLRSCQPTKTFQSHETNIFKKNYVQIPEFNFILK